MDTIMLYKRSNENNMYLEKLKGGGNFNFDFGFLTKT